MSKTIRRTASMAAVTALVAGGAIAATTAPAQAAPIKNKITISTASPTVNSGELFTINCQAKKKLAGQTARVFEKGAAFHAARTVSDSGNCTMKVVANEPGTHKFKIKIQKNAKTFVSNKLTLTIVG